jgi:hypothetical protein
VSVPAVEKGEKFFSCLNTGRNPLLLAPRLQPSESKCKDLRLWQEGGLQSALLGNQAAPVFPSPQIVIFLTDVNTF